MVTAQPMAQADAWRMIRRRAIAAGIMAPKGNHSFRATGITAYLANGGVPGTREPWQRMRAHAKPDVDAKCGAPATARPPWVMSKDTTTGSCYRGIGSGTAREGETNTATTVLARRAVWRGGLTMAHPTEQPLVVIRVALHAAGHSGRNGRGLWRRGRSAGRASPRAARPPRSTGFQSSGPDVPARGGAQEMANLL
jgi:hypothetical protein